MNQQTTQSNRSKENTVFFQRKQLLNTKLLRAFFILLFIFSCCNLMALTDSSKAYYFDGNGDYIAAANEFVFDFGTDDFTLSAWIKIPTGLSNGSYTILSKNLTTSGYPGYKLAYSTSASGGQLVFQIRPTNYDTTYSATGQYDSLDPDEWYHIAAVRDSTELRIYVNGELHATSGAVPADSNIENQHPLAIGATVSLTQANFFEGKIDEVAIYSTALNLSEIENIMNNGPDASDADLVSYYSFDAGSALDDKSNNHGTLYGDAVITVGKLSAGKSMVFDGDEDYIVAANESAFDFGTDNFSLSAWIKVQEGMSSGNHTILGKNYVGPGYSGYKLFYYVSASGGRLHFNIRPTNYSTTYTCYGSYGIEPGEWYHIVALRDGTELRIYVNGELYATSVSVVPEDSDINNQRPFAIGATVYWTERDFFEGDIDEVAIFNKALTIKEIIRTKDIGPDFQDTSLVSSYSFDDGTAADEKGNNDGTLEGQTSSGNGICYSGFNMIETIEDTVPAFVVNILPATGNISLATSDSITVADLAGIDIDDTDLSIGEHDPYPSNMSDGLSTGTGPYIAPNIAPFRFKYFYNEIGVGGGYYNFEMFEYLAVHGMNCIPTTYTTAAGWSHLPTGTQFGAYALFDYNDWMNDNSYDSGRFDLLPSRTNLETTFLTEDYFDLLTAHQIYMVDLEWPSIPLDMNNLRVQSWYPGTLENPDEEFEDDYYNGFINADLAIIDTVREQGWPEVGIYGWAPWARAFWQVGDSNYDDLCQERWDRYGKYIAQEVDNIYPSVYCFYWKTTNVSYMLHNIDRNLAMVKQLPVSKRKAVRPYYWNRHHGGGGGWRWWEGTPVKCADTRAIAAMNFFTGADGLSLYFWSSTRNDHVVNIAIGNAYYIKETCNATIEIDPDNSADSTFERNQIIFINNIDGDTARFQRLPFPSALPYNLDVTYHQESGGDWILDNPDDGNYQKPVYNMDKSVLETKLIPISAPVGSMVEGMALAKVFEYPLYYGEPCIDVSAEDQFAGTLPIIRRVRFGKYHIIATYDPKWEERGSQDIVLNNFAGNSGLNVTVKADGQTRLYVVLE